MYFTATFVHTGKILKQDEEKLFRLDWNHDLEVGNNLTSTMSLNAVEALRLCAQTYEPKQVIFFAKLNMYFVIICIRLSILKHFHV